MQIIYKQGNEKPSNEQGSLFLSTAHQVQALQSGNASNNHLHEQILIQSFRQSGCRQIN